MSTPDAPDSPKPLPNSMRTRDPWPMWPIALSIVAFISVYTWVQLNFRKEGHAFEPHQAMLDRKNAIAEKNFYDWYSLTTQRAAETIAPQSPAEISTRDFPSALDQLIPEQLKYYMSSRPVLLPSQAAPQSSSALTPGEPLAVTLSIPALLVGSDLLQLLSFYKEGRLFLLPTLFVKSIDELDPSLLQGELAPVTFLVPTDPIAAPTIQVSLLGPDQVAEWEVDNLDPSKTAVEQTDGD